MADFNVRSDSVDVEQIMRQIRARIREKRGVDYTESELQQLANVKLDKFLDPRGLRSDLVDQFRRHRVVSPEPPTYEFEDTTLYDTHRGLLRFIRKILRPVLMLLISPNALIRALHVQAQLNAELLGRSRRREAMDPLFYEVIHNLVLEVTRLGIEVHNLKMRTESLSSRLDFDERRGRSLENVVQYRPGAVQRPASAAPQGPPRPQAAPSSEQSAQSAQSAPSAPSAPGGRPDSGRPEGGNGLGGERRRRRRRRRRRPGQTMGDSEAPQGLLGSGAPAGPADSAGSPAADGGESDGPDEGASDQ